MEKQVLSIIRKIKEDLPSKLVTENPCDLSFDNAVFLVFPEEGTRCGDLILNKEMIQGDDARRIVSNPSFPLKIRILNRGEPIKRSKILPLVSWDGKKLIFSLPKKEISSSIEAAISSSLINLLSDNLEKEKAEKEFRNLLNFDLVKERSSLLHKAQNQERRAAKLIKKAQNLRASSSRKMKIIESLEQTNFVESESFASEQWQNICQLVPAALQDVSIEGDKICATTQQFLLEGILLGPYKILVPIKNPDKISILSIAPIPEEASGYQHPHIQGSGAPCWGTLTEAVSTAAGNKDFFSLISSSLMLLHQYQPNDHYRSIVSWSKGEKRVVRSNPTEPCVSGVLIDLSSFAQVRECLNCSFINTSQCPSSIRRTQTLALCQEKASPLDCIKCPKESHVNACVFKETAFSRCVKKMETYGTAFCMLKCEHYKECREAISSDVFSPVDLCKAINLPTNGLCPARDLCADPCCLSKETEDE